MAEGNSSADGSQSKQPAPTQNRSVSDSLVRNEQSRGRPAKIRDRKQLLPLRTDLFYASGDSPNVPKTVVATPPQLNFTPIEQTSSARRIMSTSALGSGDRLRPLTPIHNKNRSGTFFTTSPANSESGSPRLPASNIRSASNTSLQNLHTSGRTTPTPTRGRPGRGRNRRHQSSSHHHSPHSRKSSASNSGSSRPSTPHQNGKPSVKHLTCFWWKDKGDCRFKEEDCLYAHHDTGLYADPPRQVNPGEPALAGRSLDRALKKLQYRDDGGCNNNKSSSSLRSISTDMVIGNAIVSSRPGTPGVAVAIGPLSSPALPELVKEDELVALKSENNFFRNIVEQNTSEKALLLDNIEILQRDNKGKSQSESLP